MALHWGISTHSRRTDLRTVGRFDDIVHIIILYVYTEVPVIVLNNRSITTG